MIIIENLPGIIVIMIVAYVFGMMSRLKIEGASYKGALLAVIRSLALPLLVVSLVNQLHDHRRRIIFDLRKESLEEHEPYIKRFEYILESKKRLSWFFIKSATKMSRAIMDSYIRASVEYEAQKEKHKVSKKKKNKSKKDNFFDHFMTGSDVEGHLFHLN